MFIPKKFKLLSKNCLKRMYTRYNNFRKATFYNPKLEIVRSRTGLNFEILREIRDIETIAIFGSIREIKIKYILE